MSEDNGQDDFPDEMHNEHEPEQDELIEAIPMSNQAERALLGALLLDPKSYDRIVDRISQASFYTEQHRQIFTAISNIHAQDGKSDPISVAEMMDRLRGAAGSAQTRRDDLDYLTRLYTDTLSSASIERYAQIVSEKHFRREIISVGSDLIRIARQPSEQTGEELINLAESRLFQLSQANAREKGLVPIAEGVKEVYGELEAEQALIDQGIASQGLTGQSTGFAALDSKLDGLQPGSLVIVAARPSMGKTSLALNLAEQVGIVDKKNVAVFSLEMGTKEITRRFIGSVARISGRRIRVSPEGLPQQEAGEVRPLTDSEWARLNKAMEQISSSSIHIDESGSVGAAEIRSRARKLARKLGAIHLLVVDYLQLMPAAMGKKADTKALEIGENTRMLKALAKELNCPVVLLSQLNRSLEQRPNKRPVMSDLRDSGAIEQDADVILFIYRDEVYNPDSMDVGTAEIIIGKQRNGPIGTVKLNFLDYCTRFEDPLY